MMMTLMSSPMISSSNVQPMAMPIRAIGNDDFQSDDLVLERATDGDADTTPTRGRWY
jgi:hypothetical protein